jgi:ElaB/YqjD/DUF883 family membrane-anchored ribosome-binding protein
MNDHFKPVAAAHDPASDVIQLRADFSRLSDSVAELVKAQTNTAAASIRHGVGAASNAIAETAADFGQSALQMTNDAQKTVKAASQDLEASIERNPLTAVLIAAGIGMVFGMAISRG